MNKKIISRIVVGIITLMILQLSHAGERSMEMRMQLRMEREAQQMRDLRIDAPPQFDRNHVGPLNHFIERISDNQLKIHAYPKYFFGLDGKLTESDVTIKRDTTGGSDYFMDQAVYQFHANEDASFHVFHYGMSMAYSIVDIAYQDMKTGKLVSLDWEKTTSTPVVQDRAMRWDSIFPGIGLEIILGEDFIKENILLTQDARKRLPHPGFFNMDPNATNIVLVYAYGQEDQSGKYIMRDQSGERNAKSSFAFDGALEFMREGKVKHVFPRDEVLLPGFIDRYETPNLRYEVQKYWHSTPEGETVLCYGVPYLVHEQTSPGLITIDPTILFQDGLGGYSGAAVAVIYENAVGSVPYRTIQNFGIDPVTKLAHRVSPLVNMHTLVRFNVSGLGITSSNVLDAKVYMKCIQIDNNQYSSQSSSLYTLNREWNEGTKWAQNASTGEVTWGYAKYNQVAWGAGGANASTDRETSADGTTSMTTTPGVWDHWDATDSVKSWLSSTNYGAVIIPNWSDRTEGWVYHSDNATTGSDRPYLVINVNCTSPHIPSCGDNIEYLGHTEDISDGFIFKKNCIPTTTFFEGDQISMEWILTTTQEDDMYGGGQYLRMWIDYDGDCTFEPGEEIILKTSDGRLNPGVLEDNYQDFCESNMALESNYSASPDTPDTRHFTFTYQFTLPTNIPIPISSGIFTTKARILLRWHGWPENPTSDYYNESLPDCGSWWGDIEEYSISLVNNY